MAEPVLLSFDGHDVAFAARRVERGQLYGTRKRVVRLIHQRFIPVAARSPVTGSLACEVFHRMKRILVAFFTLLLLASPAFAQFETGNVVGTIKDSTGAVVPAAKVGAMSPGDEAEGRTA